MKLSYEIIDGVKVISFDGDSLDVNHAKEIHHELLDLLKSHELVLFNLSKIEFMDSSGLGVILSSKRQMNKKGGELGIFGVGKHVANLFRIVRMDSLFALDKSEEDALKAIRERKND